MVRLKQDKRISALNAKNRRGLQSPDKLSRVGQNHPPHIILLLSGRVGRERASHLYLLAIRQLQEHGALSVHNLSANVYFLSITKTRRPA